MLPVGVSNAVEHDYHIMLNPVHRCTRNNYWNIDFVDPNMKICSYLCRAKMYDKNSKLIVSGVDAYNEIYFRYFANLVAQR